MNTKKRLTIIGGGPGGYTAALTAADLGAHVTLIEKDKIGGVCLNLGCIPSKIMKHTADLLERCRRGTEFGLRGTDNATLNLSALHARQSMVIAQQGKTIDHLLAKAGVHRLTGEGIIKKMGCLSVRLPSGSYQEVLWDKLIIATGSTPLEMANFPFNGSTVLSSDDLIWANKLPKSLLIIGGGVIGCEFAFIMTSFGVKVTLVEAMARVLPLPAVDQECSKVLLRQMKKAGISVFLNSLVSAVQNNSTETKISISTGTAPDSTQKKERVLTADSVLVCVGRKANTDTLGLENIAAVCDLRGWIKVDDQLMTGQEGVYAIGDVLGPARVMLAHVAVREGKIAGKHSVLGEAEEMTYNTVPTTIFSRPEIGCAGLTEQTAKEQGVEIVCQTAQFRTCSKSHVIGEIDGMTKLVTEKKSGKILGVHIIGPHASDLIAEGVLAIAKKCTIKELSALIHAHPTLAEIMGEFVPYGDASP